MDKDIAKYLAGSAKADFMELIEDTMKETNPRVVVAFLWDDADNKEMCWTNVYSLGCDSVFERLAVLEAAKVHMTGG